MSKCAVKKKRTLDWSRWDWLAVLILLIGSGLPYFQVSQFAFLNYDDPLHIATQPAVLSGLNAQSVTWSMTATPSNLWHPLTWISYMAEVSWLGGGADSPGVHHLGNLFLHLGASLFFYILLRMLRISVGISAAVALLFSLHPLHVEPVAWISSRKDVLYCFFAMASLCSYVLSQMSQRKVWFWLTLLSFTAALASKPTAVVIPALFVLLDYIYLDRESLEKGLWRNGIDQLRGKWAYFLLAASAASVTVFVQYSGSHGDFIGGQDFISRVSYLPASLAYYIQHTLYPRNLTFDYAFPEGVRYIRLSIVGGATLLGLAILLFRYRERHHILIVAGLWFLICVAPVLGFFYVGSGFTADRYTYLAIAGPAIALAVYLQSLEGVRRKMLMMIVSACVLFFGILSYQQTRVWKNDIKLFTYGVATEPRSGTAHTNLATLYRVYEKDDLALAHYHKALRLNASYYIVNYNMAQIYQSRGEYEQAMEACRRSLESNPNYARSHHLLGVLLEKSPGHSGQALDHLQRAQQLMPSNIRYAIACAQALARREQFTEANEMIQQALKKCSPHSPDYQKLEAMHRKLVPYIGGE